MAINTTREACKAVVDSLLAMPRAELLSLLKQNETSDIALALQEYWASIKLPIPTMMSINLNLTLDKYCDTYDSGDRKYTALTESTLKEMACNKNGTLALAA